jgi:FkbM family methyltransferase
MSEQVIPATLRPLPSRAGRCPRCAEALDIDRLHVPGWRLLWEGSCQSCRHRYLQDLPAGHGLIYPASFDLDTGEIFGERDTGWFGNWLPRNWSHPNPQSVEVEIDGPGARGSSVLLNCLDPIYGHSLLKLLNAQRHLDFEKRDLIVLIPSSLRHLVPAGVAETWTLNGSTSIASEWLLRLDEFVQDQLDRLGDCTLSPAFPHPHPSTWQLESFTGEIQPDRRGDPSLLFAFRDDRPWGFTGRHQALNVRALWALLRRRFPEAGGALVGVGRPAGAPPGVVDLRTEAPEIEDERSWLAAARGSDLVIGVHGSHLLLPSGLAGLTLELTPAARHSNVLQATLVREPDPVLALWRYRQILGSARLADVTPLRVAAVAAEMIQGKDRYAALMAGPAAGLAADLATLEPPLLGTDRPPASSLPSASGRIERMRAVRHLVRESVKRRRASARAPRPPVVLTDQRGLRFELETPEEVQSFRTYGGHFEVAELDFLGTHSHSGIAIDVGANIGAFTALMARGAAPSGHVHAFEPLASNRRRLRRNLELNGLCNVTLHETAIADVIGTSELLTFGPGYESWASVARSKISLDSGTLEPVERVPIATTTLDEFCAAEEIDRVSVLKIDVEGAEGRVLTGARDLLAAHRIELLLLELSDNTLGADGWTSGQIVRLLRDHRYETWVIDAGELTPFRPAGHVAFANVFATPAGA